MDYKFLIIVPTLCSYKKLPKLVKSLKEQSYEKWRVTFIEGSNDSENINYLNNLHNIDKRFNWFFEDKNKPGIFPSMNLGANMASQDELTFFWGSDDWLANSKVLEIVNKLINDFLKKEKLPDLFIFNCRYVSKVNKFTRRGEFFNTNNQTILIDSEKYRNLLFNGYIPSHQATLFSPKSLEFKPLYRKQFKLSADLDFYLRLSKKKGISIGCSNIEIVHLMEGGISGQSTKQRLKEVLNAYKFCFPNFYFYPLIMRYFRKILTLFL